MAHDRPSPDGAGGHISPGSVASLLPSHSAEPGPFRALKAVPESAAVQASCARSQAQTFPKMRAISKGLQHRSLTGHLHQGERGYRHVEAIAVVTYIDPQE